MKDIKIIGEAILCFVVLCVAFVVVVLFERVGHRAAGG